MSVTWKTKFGMRRVPVETPPTLEEALYAAEGLTHNVEQQIRIAAELLQVPIEQAQTEAMPILRERRVPVTTPRREPQLVAVVRKHSRRLSTSR